VEQALAIEKTCGDVRGVVGEEFFEMGEEGRRDARSRDDRQRLDGDGGAAGDGAGFKNGLSERRNQAVASAFGDGFENGEVVNAVFGDGEVGDAVLDAGLGSDMPAIPGESIDEPDGGFRGG
jgi:hypothetical protein